MEIRSSDYCLTNPTLTFYNVVRTLFHHARFRMYDDLLAVRVRADLVIIVQVLWHD